MRAHHMMMVPPSIPAQVIALLTPTCDPAMVAKVATTCKGIPGDPAQTGEILRVL